MKKEKTLDIILGWLISLILSFYFTIISSLIVMAVMIIFLDCDITDKDMLLITLSCCFSSFFTSKVFIKAIIDEWYDDSKGDE